MTYLAEQMRAAALDCAARGWRVFPLWPNSKIPALHGVKNCPRTGDCAGGHAGWEQRATVDPERIARAWSTRPHGVGIACGPSGLVVIDLDMPKPDQPTPGVDTWRALVAEHGDAPPTWTVRTASGGWHLYYRHPAGTRLGNTTGRNGGLGPGVDTRAHGGLVVAAGVRMRRGAYTVTCHAAPVVLPAWLAERLAPKPAPPPRPATVAVASRRRAAWLTAALDRQLAYLTAATAGGRNNALYVSAVALGQLVAGGALGETDAETLLVNACLSAGFRPKASTIASGFRAGARRPRRAAA